MPLPLSIEMREEDGKTWIHSRTTAKANGVISRSMTALIKRGLVNQEQTNLTNLKQAIEAH